MTVVVTNLRSAAKTLSDLNNKPIPIACAEIVKGTWTRDDDSPYSEEHTKLSGIDRGKFYAAADRTTARDDCPFRLAALLQSVEGYTRDRKSVV